MRLPGEHPNVPDASYFWRKNSSMNLALAFASTHPEGRDTEDPVLEGCRCVTCALMLSYRKAESKYSPIAQNSQSSNLTQSNVISPSTSVAPGGNFFHSRFFLSFRKIGEIYKYGTDRLFCEMEHRISRTRNTRNSWIW
jgi:hypothetical protein